MTLACPACGGAVEANDKFCAECGASLRPAVPATPSSVEPSEVATERRFVAVLFADLVGYTPFSEHRDPEEVREFLTQYFAASRDVVGRFGGVVDKFIGDAVMAVWGAQAVQEDDAERAVRAALELIDMVAKLAADAGVPDLSLRAGIATGEAAVGPGGNEQGLVVGDIVNVASRLQTAAAPGTLLVSEQTERAARRAIQFESVGDLAVKGRAQPVSAWRAKRVVALIGGEGRADALEAPFVGRDREFRLLKELLHATTHDHRARLVSIVGLAGVGKSRLVWELEKYIDGIVDAVYWHVGRSPAYGEGVTFWALGEMVRGRCGIAEGEDPAAALTKLDDALALHIEDSVEREWVRPRLIGLLGLGDMPTGERGELFAAWRTLFARISRLGCTVLVFEELHWADAGLLDFIEELPDWSREDPILVITLARPEIFERRSGWGSGRTDNVSIHLGPLNDEAMGQLVSGLLPGLGADAVHALKERAAGIPLYAVELVRMLVNEGQVVESEGGYQLTRPLAAAAVPESLHSVIGARLDRLDRGARTLLQDASVLGQTFRLEALASLLEVMPSDLLPKLTDLVRREFLEIKRDPRAPDRGQYGFVQALIRDFAYGRLSRPDRHDRHLRAAQYLEALDEGDLAAVVASHYLAARDASRGSDRDQLSELATRALRRAVERATSLHSHQQALELSQRALSMLDDDEKRVWFVEQAAQSAHRVGQEDLAEGFARQALDYYLQHVDEAGQGRAGRTLGMVLIEKGSLDQAVVDLEGLLRERELTTNPDIAGAAAELARAYMILGRSDEAIAMANDTAKAAEQLNMTSIAVQALITRGSALGDEGRTAEAVAVLQGALDRATDDDLMVEALRARNNLGFLVTLDDPSRGAHIFSDGMTEALRVGERYWAEVFTFNLADSLWACGRLSEARSVVDEWEPAMSGAFAEPLQAIGLQVAALQSTSFVEANRLDERLPNLAMSADPAERGDFAIVEGLLILMGGQPGLAFDHLADALENLPGVGMSRPLNLLAHTAAWSRDIRRVRRGLILPEGRPWKGRVFDTMVRHLHATAAVLTNGENGAPLADVANDLAVFGLALDATLTWAELALLTTDSDLAVEADRKARDRFAEMRADGLLGLYERSLESKDSGLIPTPPAESP